MILWHGSLKGMEFSNSDIQTLHSVLVFRGFGEDSKQMMSTSTRRNNFFNLSSLKNNKYFSEN